MVSMGRLSPEVKLLDRSHTARGVAGLGFTPASGLTPLRPHRALGQRLSVQFTDDSAPSGHVGPVSA